MAALELCASLSAAHHRRMPPTGAHRHAWPWARVAESAPANPPVAGQPLDLLLRLRFDGSPPRRRRLWNCWLWICSKPGRIRVCLYQHWPSAATGAATAAAGPWPHAHLMEAPGPATRHTHADPAQLQLRQAAPAHGFRYMSNTRRRPWGPGASRRALLTTCIENCVQRGFIH